MLTEIKQRRKKNLQLLLKLMEDLPTSDVIEAVGIAIQALLEKWLNKDLNSWTCAQILELARDYEELEKLNA